MVSAVSQMLHHYLALSGALNLTDPHFVSTFHPRGLLNTTFYLSPFQTGRTLNHLPLFCPHPQQSIQKYFKLPSIFLITTNPQGLNGILYQLPTIMSIRNLSSCLCVASGDTSLEGSQHMWPLIPHPNLMTVNTTNTFSHL